MMTAWFSVVMSGRCTEPDPRVVTQRPTPYSIAAAKLAAAIERRQIFEQTGVVIYDDGRIVTVERS